MTLQAAPQLAGRTITVQDSKGLPVVVSVDEEGFLSTGAITQVIRDGDGNLLEALEVEHPVKGEPALHYFVFPELGGIPAELETFSVEVDGQLVVPARYVRGTHVEREVVEISEELEDLILAHQATAGLLRRVDNASEVVQDEAEGSEASDEDGDEAPQDEE